MRKTKVNPLSFFNNFFLIHLVFIQEIYSPIMPKKSICKEAKTKKPSIKGVMPKEISSQY